MNLAKLAASMRFLTWRFSPNFDVSALGYWLLTLHSKGVSKVCASLATCCRLLRFL